MNFLKTTLIGGLLFLVPLVVVGVVISKAVGIMLVIAEPMAAFLPIESAAGVALANLIALACVVLLCFLAGLVGRTALAKAFSDKAESTILQKIPGYTFFKGMTSMLSPDENADLKAVLVSLEKAERLGLEVERVGADRMAVYFPGSPNAWSGIVQIVSTDQVKPIDIPMMSVIEHAEQLGRGANKILATTSDSQGKQ